MSDMEPNKLKPTKFSQSQKAQSPGGPNLLLTFWRHKWLVLLMLLIGWALGAAYFVTKKPVYRSAAQILIIEEQSKLPAEGVEVRMASDEVHAMLVRSQAVIEDAIELGDLTSLDSFQEVISPVGTIMQGLGIETAATNAAVGNVILDLTYECEVQEDCPKVLKAIVQAYEAFLSEVSEDVSGEMIKLIERAKSDLDSDIQKSQVKYHDLIDVSPSLLTDEYGLNAHQARALSLQERVSELAMDTTRLQAQIDALEADPEAGKLEVLDLIVAQSGNTNSRVRFDDAIGSAGLLPFPRELVPLMVEELRLTQKFAEGHPQIETVREQIALMKELLRQEDQEPPDYYALYLNSLRKGIDINERELARVNELYTAELESAKRVAKHALILESARSEMDRKTRFFDAIVSRLEEMSLFKQRGNSDVKTVNRPSPAWQVEPAIITVALMSTFLGLVSGLGLAFLVDEADRRFRSPEEIRNDFGVPVIGHIPLTSRAQADDSKLLTLEEPHGAIAEAYRSVRTAIYFNARGGGGHQVVQVTSPSPGDGKTTLASNLAVSIAQSGKQVLLLDADLRRPRCHQVFETENKQGLSTLLAGEGEWTDAVQATEVEGLSLMPCGTRMNNPSELLASKRFGELLAFLREQFDMIIVDSPPALVVTDALDVAAQVDAVLLVLRLTKTARQAGRRTLDALEEIGAEVAGVVVNGVAGKNGYGSNNYSQYKYKYGNAYGQGNGYSYKYRNGYAYGDPTEEAEPKRRPAKAVEGNGKH